MRSVEETAQVGAALAASVGFLGGINDWTTPFLGVPLIAVGMAAAGALLSFAHGSAVESRKQLFHMALANTIVGSTATGLLPAVFGWTWVNEALQPPLAFFLALSCRWAIPLLVEVAPAAVRGGLSKMFGITISEPRE
ncbi:MAG: hypothetical protein DDT26_00046 [Dehalococcoidia bacterium]|nr:hypothetical protein [Chloroflexota bacterium]